MTAVLPFPAPVSAAAAVNRTKEVRELIPVGHTVGVKLFSDGVMVVGISMVETETGKVSPAAEAGLMEGDIITHIGDAKVSSNEQLQKAVRDSGGEITVRIRRKGRPMQLNIAPAKCKDGNRYMLGVWVRDSMAGIGTLTFYDPETDVFGALGHGINDVDTSELMQLSSGAIMYSTVKSVQKGAAGAPGEIKGDFNLLEDAGVLFSNTECGIFGKLNDLSLIKKAQAVPVASKDEVSTGKAVVMANVSGDQVESFDVEIIKIYPDESHPSRNMMIKITDERLIALTGGIVQGMSGSPILQNGKLIGAVTHVLVNDPKKGYGIFIENMLEEAYAEGSAAA